MDYFSLAVDLARGRAEPIQESDLPGASEWPADHVCPVCGELIDPWLINALDPICAACLQYREARRI
jgi:hypothetical protein